MGVETSLVDRKWKRINNEQNGTRRAFLLLLLLIIVPLVVYMIASNDTIWWHWVGVAYTVFRMGENGEHQMVRAHRKYTEYFRILEENYSWRKT